MDPREPHPWNDAYLAPQNFDRALEQPALGVNPNDAQDFYDYQARLAIHNEMLHEEARQSSASFPDPDLAPRLRQQAAMPPNPTEHDYQRLDASFSKADGDPLQRQAVLQCFGRFLLNYAYTLRDDDYARLAAFLGRVRHEDEFLFNMFLRLSEKSSTFRDESRATLQVAERATAAARNKQRALQQQTHEDEHISPPTLNQGVWSWLPWIRQSNERLQRDYSLAVSKRNGLPSKLSEQQLAASTCERNEKRARRSFEHEAERARRWERILSCMR